MRVRTVEGGVTTYYAYNGLNVIQEHNLDTGERTDFIFAGTKRIAAKDSLGTMYYHEDHLGSTRVITDSIGSVGTTYKYDAFGQTISHIGDDVKYKFAGKPEDAERVYSISRPDTMMRSWEGSYQLIPLEYANWYAYCINNPLRFIRSPRSL